jgi:hypothetical protein
MLPVLIGVALLAVDASRFGNLLTSLQKGADALALAGAAELDRKPDAITRADGAIANMVANRHKFAVASPATVAASSVRYLKSLPASDASVIDASHETTDPTLARFVEVAVTPQTLNTVLPAAYIGGATSVTTTARAVAGFDAAVCQFTPIFMCNPFEGSGTSIFEAVNDPAIRRRQIVLRKKGGGSSQYAPGNYGFLQPPGGEHGANAIREMLGLVRPPACFVQNGVRLRPGFIASADQGLNVRFDMFDGPLNGQKSNPDFRPALNVRKGYAYGGNPCNASPTPPNQGLPDDDCMASSTCPYMSGRMGDGVWNIDGYKAANNLGAIPYSNANPASRYDVYRYEIDNSLVSTASTGGEVGTPKCYNGGGLGDDPDRRILYIAAVDCQAHNVEDDNSGNSGPPVPVTAFVKMFLTRPVNQGPDQDIYAEMVGVIEPGTVSNSVARDIVQLYR